MKNKTELIIYQGRNGGIEFRGDLKEETLWANLNQISNLFGVDKSGISRHIKNIFETGELAQNSVVAKNATTASDGKRYEVDFYNLDMILSIGYRVNSKMATEFRKWATKTLKTYLTSGFVIDRKKVGQNYEKFMEAIEETKKLLPENVEAFGSLDSLDLVKLFAKTWLSLDAYDKQSLILKKQNKKTVKLAAEELTGAIAKFKMSLIKKGEATELFAKDRSKNSLEGIVGNVMQGFGGKSVYESVEEKAAHLLYFIIKNHPFVDGNKRTGAYSFIWFLHKVKMLDMKKITPETLTALTLLVAECNPSHKENIIKLIMKLIER
jgi:prophage maintenance system killer protein